MSAILKFDFQKKKTITFFWSKLSKLHKKDQIFACDNYIYPKTRGKKNKRWTHSTPLKGLHTIPYSFKDDLYLVTFKSRETNVKFLINIPLCTAAQLCDFCTYDVYLQLKKKCRLQWFKYDQLDSIPIGSPYYVVQKSNNPGKNQQNVVSVTLLELPSGPSGKRFYF